jgi:hypothetical protein
VALVLVVVSGGWWPERRRAAAEDPAAEITEAIRRWGPPAVLWGRLASEEESPDGPWTPLAGIEVEVFPAAPGLLADLERIRRSARESGAQYESAITRLQAALAAHRTRVETVVRGATAPGTAAGPPRGRVIASREADGYRGADAPDITKGPGSARRQTTDSAGLFAFTDLPSGDWLLVAFRVTPSSQARGRTAPKALSPSRAKNFLPSAASPTKESEVWLTTVRVPPESRTALFLTDRARWMVGPVP